jgi:hypothetical protein
MYGHANTRARASMVLALVGQSSFAQVLSRARAFRVGGRGGRACAPAPTTVTASTYACPAPLLRSLALLRTRARTPALQVPTTLLSLFTLACLLAARSKLKLPKWFPMQLMLIVVTTAFSYILDFESHGVAIVGA